MSEGRLRPHAARRAELVQELEFLGVDYPESCTVEVLRELLRTEYRLLDAAEHHPGFSKKTLSELQAFCVQRGVRFAPTDTRGTLMLLLLGTGCTSAAQPLSSKGSNGSKGYKGSATTTEDKQEPEEPPAVPASNDRQIAWLDREIKDLEERLRVLRSLRASVSHES
jgi:hypothetical protein